jgi:bcr-type benzoyl-CoA reductase subunit C
MKEFKTEVDFDPQIVDPGRASIGWLCTYTPEEVIYAAGFHPFRLLEDAASTKLADTYLHYNLCPYVRSCLDFGLRKKNQAFKGIVIVNSCDAVRSLYHIWNRYLSSETFIHFMDLPKVATSLAVDYFRKEIQKLITSLENHFSRPIKESALKEAIEIYNESRDLMRELYELRKNQSPLINGTLVSKIVRANQRMPKKTFNQKLKKLIQELKTTKVKTDQPNRPRIIIVGSLLSNSQLIEAVEAAGAVVVYDDLCTGSRYFEGRVEGRGDLVEALSRHYLLKTPCARMKDTSIRLEAGKTSVKEYRVDGIIYQTLKFCDNHLYDYPVYQEFFKKMDVPMLQIENDFVGGNLGQIKTRIEAFIEMLSTD